MWVLRCVVLVMRFVFHCFMFQYRVVAIVDVMVVLLSYALRYCVCCCVKDMVVNVVGNDN
jgi:hypothetical protein